ncbi:FG-GAP-like repeat-containing protein, partial [Cronbergia sp. UHCC 0137]|uniref:FG-GAP-like repeat-containing protein n=1 Tax=Cronbergia sp. UHCC 0137 TaxID=3110239 RepID=UPI002B203BF6
MVNTFFPPLKTDTTYHPPSTLVVIDSAVKDYQILANGILPTAQVIVLNKDEDGINQISKILSQQPVHSLQIISHGNVGSLQLGSSQLNLENIASYHHQLQQWKTAEILLYSCQVAAGERGKTFLQHLHLLTSANIAASAEKIGNIKLGGNWELGVKIGQISSTLAILPEVAAGYPGILVTFGTPDDFNVGLFPYSIVAGDFNGDGKLDLVAANSSENNVSVLLGDGTGNFNPAINFNVGSSPLSVTLGDFNGDGNLDLATANSDNDNVSILLGDGTGNFNNTTNFNAGRNPYSIAAGDFNGDGNLDLVTANSDTSNNTSVLLGDGAGGFGSPSNFAVGIFPRYVAVDDFNSDGNLDLVTANRDSNDISVLLGNGAGGFGTATNFNVGSNPFGVAIADFNGDGNVDLGVANSADNNISVLLGDGSGGFGNATNFNVGNTPFAVKPADFNNDGKIDLVVANFAGNDISVLLGDGTGSFGNESKFVVGSSPISLKVADFNVDGKLDVAVANADGNNISVLLNTTPSITITAGGNSTEGGVNGSFNITLDTPAPVGGLIVNFDISGSTATDTTDYSLTTGTNITNISTSSFTIAAGFTTATLNVEAVLDTILDDNETVQINILSGSDYVLSDNSSASLIIIDKKNESPAIAVPSTQTVNEDTNLILTGINITDADVGTGSLQVSLSATNGTINLSDTTGLTFNSGSNNSKTMTFTGSLTDINIAIDDLVYLGDLNFNGSDTVSISVDDLGNTGSGGSLTDTQNIPIIINAVNDAPTDLILSSTSVDENVVANTVIGTFSNTDSDTSDTFTYS